MEDFTLEEAFMFDPVDHEGQDILYTNECVDLIKTIREKIDEMITLGHEPKFVLVNKRNYERLIAYSVHSSYGNGGLVDEIFGLTLILWDVPIDYVNVRAKASVEFAYEGSLRKTD